jgi:acyl carrier protein
MNAQEIIVEIIANVLRIDLENIKKLAGEDPLNAIGMDSLNCMDIVVNIEEHFEISFDDEELLLENLNSINKLSAIVAHKVGQHSLT